MPKQKYLILPNNASSRRQSGAQAKSFIGELARICFLTFVFIISCYFVTRELIDFLTYPVQTQRKHVAEKQIMFPAVAVCNSNPFSTNYSINYLVDYLESNTKYSYLQAVNSNSSQNLTKLSFLNKIFATDSNVKYLIRSTFYNLNDSIKKQFSLPMNETILNCQFKSKKCSDADFKWFYSFHHGTCHLFNTHGTHRSTDVGIESGLKLELFTGLESSVPNLHNAVGGFQIFLFNQSDNYRLMDTFRNKIVVETGTELTVGMDRVFSNRLEKPYTDCTRATLNLNQNTTYKHTICVQLCVDDVILKKCGCTTIGSKKGARACSRPLEITCALHFYRENLSSQCEQLCPLECESQDYRVKSSSAKQFPTNFYAHHLLETRFVKYYDSLTVDEVKKSVSRLNLFYEDLSFELITQIPSYSTASLFAHIGGILTFFIVANLKILFKCLKLWCIILV